MSHLLREERKEEMEDPRIYDFSCLKDPEVAKKMLSCGLCKKLAKDAVELTCSQHLELLVISVFCEGCLTSYLSENNNLCPFTKHPNPTYAPQRTVRIQVLSLEVFCPHGNSHKREGKEDIPQFSLLAFVSPTLHSLPLSRVCAVRLGFKWVGRRRQFLFVA